MNGDYAAGFWLMLSPAAAMRAATCPKCSHDEANYMEIQTRSADEPATVFYRCVECTHRWKEG
jgi:DNA-directed RNA polymerase subunit M/transcription elongation factor TFIIS